MLWDVEYSTINQRLSHDHGRDLERLKPLKSVGKRILWLYETLLKQDGKSKRLNLLLQQTNSLERINKSHSSSQPKVRLWGPSLWRFYSWLYDYCHIYWNNMSPDISSTSCALDSFSSTVALVLIVYGIQSACAAVWEYKNIFNFWFGIHNLSSSIRCF